METHQTEAEYAATYSLSEQQERVARKIAILVAWPYANGPRHLGHGASLVPGDILARYHRSVGDDVLMVSGTDEYGTPNMIAAEKAHQDTQDFVDNTNQVIRQDFVDLGMSFDWFTRTTSPKHAENAQEVFKLLVDNEFIEKGTMLGAFDSATEEALPDRYIEGGCPHCQAIARGDQCDNCSNLLEPIELINPVSKLTHNPVNFKETDHYFLQLQKLSRDVKNWLAGNDHLRPNAQKFSMDLADQLRPRAITRDMKWGIPLPEGYELSGDNEKVLYVWFEAVIGYLSASMEWAEQSGNSDAWKDWWQNSSAEHFYAMGKDNVPFHTLIWPAMIAAINKSQPENKPLHQPDFIASTEYLTFNESKLSTSQGNTIYISDLLSMVGQDALRYYLIAAGPETHDVNFSFHELERRVNNELLAKWGNLVNRSTSLIFKNHDGKIPTVDEVEFSAAEHALLDDIALKFQTIGELIEATKFSAAIKSALDSATAVNKYIFDTKPWETISTNRPQADKSMYVIMIAIKNINLLLSPFIPHASQKVHTMLGGTDELMSNATEQDVTYPGKRFEVLSGSYVGNKDMWSFSNIAEGQKLIPMGHLFQKLDEKKLEEQFREIIKLRKLGSSSIASS